MGEAVFLATTVGISVLFWRPAANAPIFNDDPVWGLSPNDGICPVITYLFFPNGLKAVRQS